MYVKDLQNELPGQRRISLRVHVFVMGSNAAAVVHWWCIEICVTENVHSWWFFLLLQAVFITWQYSIIWQNVGCSKFGNMFSRFKVIKVTTSMIFLKCTVSCHVCNCLCNREATVAFSCYLLFWFKKLGYIWVINDCYLLRFVQLEEWISVTSSYLFLKRYLFKETKFC